MGPKSRNWHGRVALEVLQSEPTSSSHSPHDLSRCKEVQRVRATILVPRSSWCCAFPIELDCMNRYQLWVRINPSSTNLGLFGIWYIMARWEVTDNSLQSLLSQTLSQDKAWTFVQHAEQGSNFFFVCRYPFSKHQNLLGRLFFLLGMLKVIGYFTSGVRIEIPGKKPWRTASKKAYLSIPGVPLVPEASRPLRAVSSLSATYQMMHRWHLSYSSLW